jgi:trk system potassium uptake protein TrkA
MLDVDPGAIESIGDALDVRTYRGHASDAAALREAGAADCDLLIAATNSDETNLLCASIGKGLGAAKSIARVHHSAFYDRRHIDYARHLYVDRLVCPEYITAVEIAGSLRNPGALAIEHFARGQLEMQQIVVTEGAPVVGVPLRNVRLPKGTRLGTVARNGTASVPDGQTVLEAHDVITLIGETRVFAKASEMFQSGQIKRRHIAIMGGSAISVWLARALPSPQFSVRLFERNRARAESLADKLGHITVIQADPTDLTVFAEEKLDSVDAFVAGTNDDEHNLLASMLVKSRCKARTVAVIQRSTYLHLLENIGLDMAYSPRVVASKEILRLAYAGPIQSIASLDEAAANVYEIRPQRSSAVLGVPLAKLSLPTGCAIAAIQRGDDVSVPGGSDTISPGDVIIAIAPADSESRLRKTFLK